MEIGRIMNEDDYKNNPYATLGSGIGIAIAIGLAFKYKTGFWKGVGYTIVGSIALGGIGRGIDAISSKNK